MRTVFITFLVLTLLIVGCAPRAGMDPRPPEERDYYQGYDGVLVRFADRDSPPSRLYFYSDTNDNTFDITAEIWNRGSSHTKGGVYLSGYDPNLIQVAGINPDLSGFGTCGFSIGNIGFGVFGLDLFCDSGSLSVGKRDRCLLFDAGVNDIPILGGIDFDFSANCDNTGVTINVGNAASIEYGSRGRLMIALFAGIDFSNNFGIQYLLAGDTPDYPGGDLALVDWDANIATWPAGLDETRQTFMITNCYLYTTHAAPVVCVDPSPFSEGQKVCRATHFKPTKGQGAPVAVTLIEQENTPRQSIFTIHVSNRGRGTVWDPGMIEKCSPYQGSRVTSADHNIVWLGQIRVSGDPTRLDCTPDDFIRLDRDSNRGFITCRYDIPFQGLKTAYQTPLIVELWYGYEDTVRKNVLIKRAT